MTNLKKIQNDKKGRIYNIVRMCDTHGVNMKIKKRVFEIIEKAKPEDKISKIFDISIILLILFNILAVIISSFNNLGNELLTFLKIFEIFSIIVFTIEYILRLWTSTLLFPKSKYPYLKYIFSFMAIIDLLAIIPFYMPFLIPCDLRFLRMLRLLRILRIFKLNRYNDAMSIITRVLINEKHSCPK